MSGFEGSYLGKADAISPDAIMECKICWTPYDPAEGDEFRQIMAGTPFLALPHDWKCPTCDAPKEQFMVLSDPGSEAARVEAELARATARLEADFREVYNGKMRDVPLVNVALHVEAVGFRLNDGRPVGVLISPWFMNLIQLPAPGEDWSDLHPGTKEVVSFPSGDYEFIHNVREMTGGYKACSLFSPMGDFRTQAQAVEVAHAVMAALFDTANRADTDRAADIRARREAELEPPVQIDAEPTRRSLISGGMARQSRREA
jgi:[NiFe] hydrogenase assembly HybE family chaperone